MASYEDHFEIQTAVTELQINPPCSLVEMATAHFPHGCLTVSFPFHFNSMGCFCCFHVIGPACEPRALINPLLPLKRYRTSIIDAADCCHLEVSIRKLITRVARLPAAAATAALCFLLVLRHAGLHSPGGVIHYFLSLAVAGVRAGGGGSRAFASTTV